ncbi:MAG: protoheme IX farnesyltransferase [Gemmatimonadetes bacterium]|nr:protoheme IX farnesyltransferase [Gemmatimonadota bacterium]
MSGSRASAAEAAEADVPGSRPGWHPFAELTKPRLTSLVLATTALGYLLAAGSLADPLRLLVAVVGTALIGGGANGLNQWWEVAADARMRRTQGRPFPSGRITPRAGVVFCLALTLLGLALLYVLVNPLTAVLGAVSWGVYLFAYTPLKPRTTLNTLVGAVSGAVPPVMGWTAATGRLDAGAWVLFAVLFIWQIPHFLAIAWIYREDYESGGFRMLPVIDPAGAATFRIALVYCVALMPVTYTAVLVGMGGWIYLAGATVLGLGMTHAAFRLHRERSVAAARHLFFASLAYLPVLFLLMLLDPTAR